MRPDLSGVLLRVNDSARAAIVLQALSNPEANLLREDVLTLVATFIANGLSVAISLPGRPGHMNVFFEINGKLEAAVQARDLSQAHIAMLDAISYARGLPSDPVVVSRVDPCPCGSGARFKHCHGKAS